VRFEAPRCSLATILGAAASALLFSLLAGCGQPDAGGAHDALPDAGQDAHSDAGSIADAGIDVVDARAETGPPPVDAGLSCTPPDAGGTDGGLPPSTMGNLVPLPSTVTPAAGTFKLTAAASIYVEPASAEMMAVGQYLAGKLRTATGYPIPVAATSGPPPFPSCNGSLYLTTAGGDPSLGAEGYTLGVSPEQVRLSAYQAAGIFHGVQTIRQLLPPGIESATAQAGPWSIQAGAIRDVPRFAWRGTMLDVARHFFSVPDVETYIDILPYYKINTLHLHLTDDQGWRIAIDSWPNLATYGGSTEVGGGAGGYYTHSDYSAIVAYAAARYITIVPEIDMPGHTNAALASYADLDCNGVAPPLYTGTTVGASSLCVNNDANTYQFVSDVIGEVAALTPGPYLHVGGDEATATSPADFQSFFAKVQPIVKTAGKTMCGWDAVGQVTGLSPGSIVQLWGPNDGNFAQQAVSQGAKILMSPAKLTYMDMKYDASTPYGQTWAGYIDERTAYGWDPATAVAGIAEANIVGVEAPLWTEYIPTLPDVEYMAFPRLAGYAEIGWSPAAGRSWDEYKVRIGSQGSRLKSMGVNVYESSEIPWQ